MIKFTVFFAAMALEVFAVRPARAAEAMLELKRYVPDIPPVWIEWKAASFPLIFRKNPASTPPGKMSAYVKLEGKFTDPLWALVWDGAKKAGASTRRNQAFAFEFEVTEEVNDVDFTLVGPQGQVAIERVYLYVKDVDVYRRTLGKQPPKFTHFTPSLGFNFLSYEQTGVTPFSLTSLAFKASFSYLIGPPRWDIGANVYFNFVPLGSSVAGNAISILGANVRGGYVFPFVRSPWRLTFSTGIFYSTTFVTNNAFGYTGLLNFQLYPALRYTFRNRQAAVMYLKYVPLGSGFFDISFEKREIAVGWAWVWPLEDRRSWSLALDISDLRLVTVSGVVIQAKSTTISAGYSF
ncbi:MAG: hypothetical protein AB7P04_13130 [Bacteriovoracia bacterium]